MLKIIFAFLFLPLSFADAQDQAETLAPIVVEDEKDSPNQHVIRMERLEQKQAEDLEDAFRSTPDVTVGGAQSAAQKIYVRGIEDTNLNVTIDGARQGGYLFHHQGRLNVEPELLKKIEVNAGTGNALSGPGALGGSIRFETKDAGDFLLPGDSIGAFLKGRYGTAADEKAISLGVFGKPTEDSGLLAYANLSETMDYREGGGDRQKYTAARPKNALGKLTYQLTEFQKLTLSAVYVEDNARRTTRAHFGSSAGNAPNNQEFGTLTYSARYDYDPASPRVNAKIEAYDTATKLHISRDDGSTTDAEVHSIGSSASNRFDFGKTELTIAVDGTKDMSESSRAAVTQKETGSIFGASSQVDVELHRRWTVSGGARFDQYSLKDVSATHLEHSRISPNANITHRWSESLRARLGWSQAFRGVTPMETILISNSVGARPVSDLKGTVAETSEIGLAFMKRGIGADLSFYNTRLKNPVNAANDSSNFIVRSNGKDIVTEGFTLASSIERSAWSYRLAFAHNNVRYGADPIGYTGTSFNRGASFGDRITAGVDHRLAALGVVASFESQFIFKLTDVPPGASQQPGYNTQDVSVTYMPWETVNLGLSVNNIFDFKYVAHGTPYLGVNGVTSMFEPGRDIRLSASVLF